MGLGQKFLTRVGSKAGLASYLLRVKSMLGSDQGPISNWLTTFIGLDSNTSLSYIKGCNSVNKQINKSVLILSLPNLEGFV